MSAIFEWIVFLALSAIAVGTAAGMLLTMSMYRAGLALMSSFVALAGLFILLDANLLAAIQIMMNVGGMLVMILFMVMMMMDPGGEMMWGMKRDMGMPGPGALSMTTPREGPPEEPAEGRGDGGETGRRGDGETRDTETRRRGDAEKDSPLPLGEVQGEDGSTQHPALSTRHQGHGGMSPQQHYQMMASMAMSTAQLPLALALGAVAAALLILLVVLTPWPLAQSAPDGSEAPAAVGHLLLSRYMIAFEGAAYLILAGIAGAVILGKRERGAEAPRPEGGMAGEGRHEHRHGGHP